MRRRRCLSYLEHVLGHVLVGALAIFLAVTAAYAEDLVPPEPPPPNALHAAPLGSDDTDAANVPPAGDHEPAEPVPMAAPEMPPADALLQAPAPSQDTAPIAEPVAMNEPPDAIFPSLPQEKKEDIMATTPITVGIPSIMYTSEEMHKLRRVIAIYEANRYAMEGRAKNAAQGEDDFLKVLESQKKVASNVYTYPQFFLESIVYHSPKDWSVWISGEKIAHNAPSLRGDLTVMEITKNSVLLRWKPELEDLERARQTWKKNPNDKVRADVAEGTFEFTLLPNQAFSAYDMTLIEGKIPPIQEETGISKPSLDVSAPPALQLPGTERPLPTGRGPVAAPPRSGLEGLINRHQNKAIDPR